MMVEFGGRRRSAWAALSSMNVAEEVPVARDGERVLLARDARTAVEKCMMRCEKMLIE